MEILSGPSCDSLSPNVIGCNDNYCRQQSSVVAGASKGIPYYIRVGSANNGSGGSFILEVMLRNASTPYLAPANDECESALYIQDRLNGPYNNIVSMCYPQLYHEY